MPGVRPRGRGGGGRKGLNGLAPRHNRTSKPGRSTATSPKLAPFFPVPIVGFRPPITDASVPASLVFRIEMVTPLLIDGFSVGRMIRRGASLQ